MLSLALAAFMTQTAAADATGVTLSPPRAIVEVDSGRLKGDLVRLAWAPDGTQLYLQAMERDGRGLSRSVKHYVVSTAERTLKGVDQEPVWASKYWAWKSAQASPAAAAFRIAVDSRQQPLRATSAPTGGALAKGGGVDPLGGTTVADVASAADQTQMQTIYTLKIRGETIGEWINEAVMPGVNFGWAPSPLRLIVFAKRDGGPLMVLDEAGRKHELTAAKTALLPAWSDDGSRIAWLERKDKKKYDLTIAEVSAP